MPLEYARRAFHFRPDLAAYRGGRELARQVGRWETVRLELLRLLEQPRLSELLIRVHLEEGELDHALEPLEARRANGDWAHGYAAELEIEVAQAAEAEQPRAALEIYRRRAETLIEQRGRGNYVEASHLLTHVRALHERLEEAGAWRRYLDDLRQRHKALRALREELAAAGL